MATSSIWVNPTQITEGPGIEVDSTGTNSARVSARISSDPASILQFNPDGSLAAYEGGSANVVRVVPNDFDLTQYAGQYVIYRDALYSFVPDDPLLPTIGEYKQRGVKQFDSIPSVNVGSTIIVDTAIYVWDGTSYKQRTLKQYNFDEIPSSDVGAIYVSGIGTMEWSVGGNSYVTFPTAGESTYGYMLEASQAQVNAGTGSGAVTPAKLMQGASIQFSANNNSIRFPAIFGNLTLKFGGGNYQFNDNAVVFNTPFPLQGLAVFATSVVETNPMPLLVCSSLSTSGFTLSGRSATNTGVVPGWVNWLAIGR
jgi:hypothetical protein